MSKSFTIAQNPVRELTASDITQTALTLLKLRRISAWRQPNNVAKRRKGTAKSGVSDILGVEQKTGRICACEVKKIGDRLSDDQIEFLEMVQASGGIALIACQIKNLAELVPFDEYRKKI